MPKTPPKRTILCPLCETPQDIGKRTMSTICTKCHQPIRTENVKIDGYWAGTDFVIAGDMLVQKRGVLVARVRADNIIIEGEVKGPLHVRDKVRVGPKGRVHGEVIARTLKMEDGAAFIGRVDIRPTNRRPPARTSGLEPPILPSAALDGRPSAG